MIEIAEVFRPDERELWLPIKQCGVKHVVGGFGLQPKPNAGPERQPWSYMSLLRTKTAYENAGFDLAVIENRPPLQRSARNFEPTKSAELRSRWPNPRSEE